MLLLRPLGFPRHRCRGLIEAASMVCSSPNLRRSFPRHRCRGLIEATISSLNFGSTSRFPRHRCRGLIEAGSNDIIPGDPIARFPRHRCRGLIEAWRALRALATLSLVFRGIDAAASLKPGRQETVTIRSDGFPRHRCRGLIEADEPQERAHFLAAFSAASMPRPH